jgi:hypothetical protein
VLKRISFVCQSGRLEPQAILLAASLRRHCPSSLKLLAAYPHRHGELAQSTLKSLKRLEVEIVPIINPLDDAYLIGHKLAAMRLLEGPGLGMFLDSDILAMRKPEELTGTLAAVPASFHRCPLSTWQYIYERFGLSFPQCAPPTLVSRATMVPYYNSGVIALPGEMAKRFADIWTECALRIDSDPKIPKIAKRPFLDQTSFPVAVVMSGLLVETLGPQWNFPSLYWRIGNRSRPIFFHYQDLKRLKREPATFNEAFAAVAFSPIMLDALHPLFGYPAHRG